MAQVSYAQALSGVGRLFRGQRNLGCVGYSLRSVNEQRSVVRFDPWPHAAPGDVFNLTLEDGRILECEVLDEHVPYCAVLDGPRIERRRVPIARAVF